MYGIEGAGKGVIAVKSMQQILKNNLLKALDNKWFINFDKMTMKISEMKEGLFKAITIILDIVLGRK